MRPPTSAPSRTCRNASVEREAHALDLCGERRLAEAEQAQAFQGGDPLRWRRQLADRDVPVPEPQRLDPPRLEPGEIRLVQPRAGRHRARRLSAVEHSRPLLGQAAQAVRQRRQADGLARGRGPAEDRRCSDPGGRRDRPDREAVLGGSDRVAERRVEAVTPEAIRQRRPPGDGPRHGHRPGSCLLDWLDGIRRRRGRAGRVEPVQRLAVPDEREGVAAYPGGHRLCRRRARRPRRGRRRLRCRPARACAGPPAWRAAGWSRPWPRRRWPPAGRERAGATCDR